MIDDMYNYLELPRLMAEEIITVQPMILPIAKDFILPIAKDFILYDFPEFFKKEEFDIT